MRNSSSVPVKLNCQSSASSTAIRNYLLGQFLPRNAVLEELESILEFRFNMTDPTVMEPEEIMPMGPRAVVQPELLWLTVAEVNAGLALGLGLILHRWR